VNIGTKCKENLYGLLDLLSGDEIVKHVTYKGDLDLWYAQQSMKVNIWAQFEENLSSSI
jgi:hypothetical protein